MRPRGTENYVVSGEGPRLSENDRLIRAKAVAGRPFGVEMVVDGVAGYLDNWAIINLGCRQYQDDHRGRFRSLQVPSARTGD
jgi:hypothetical protein